MNFRKHFSGTTGFTLLELLLVVSIAAILLIIGIPSFENFRLNQKMSASIGLLHSQLVFARDQAMKFNDQVIVCPGNTQSGCTQSNDWTQGWIIFDDLNADRQLSGPERLLRHEPPLEHLLVMGNAGRHFVHFYGNGSAPNSNGSITFCDKRGPEKARKLVISNIGRIRRDEAKDMNSQNCPLPAD